MYRALKNNSVTLFLAMKNDKDKYLGARLRAERIRAGFATAKSFSANYEIPEEIYRSNENGSRSISKEKAKKYSAIFNKPIAYFLDENYHASKEVASPEDTIQDADIALTFALKVVINEIIAMKKSARMVLKKEFQNALDHLPPGKFLGATILMNDLLEHVSDKPLPRTPEKVQLLSQLVPVGSA